MDTSLRAPGPTTWRRLDAALRALYDRRVRLVGWGSGSVFDYFHRLAPLPLECLVDNDPTRWGRQRHGIVIYPPTALDVLGEDVLVVIYSGAWPDIQAQIRGLGRLRSIPASTLFADAGTRTSLDTTERLATGARPRTPRASRSAIVVQGPIDPDATPQVVRAMSAAHPESTLVLSTWEDTPSDSLDAVRPWADEVVLSARPSNPGIQNRNLQIVSTRAGLARAAERGALDVLKTRSDLAVLEPRLFDQARWWRQRVGNGHARAAGLRERIVVPACYTRKYLLYHPSDLVQIGTTPDLEAFWSAPLDERTGSLLAPEWLDRPLADVNLAGNPSESYLGLALCRTLGRPCDGTLSDSWAFYRDLFIVVDNTWFDLVWVKNPAIPDAALTSGIRETVRQGFWQRLQLGDDGLTAACDPRNVPLRALTEAAA